MKLLMLLVPLLFIHSPMEDQLLVGAWEYHSGTTHRVMIFSAGYFSVSEFDVTNKTFAWTAGGSWSVKEGQLTQTFEFNTHDPSHVGTTHTSAVLVKKSTMTVKDEVWKRLDNGSPGKLAGAWLITGRMENGKLSSRTPGPRKTMKILSGTRFQWIAYNVDTKQFFGTGGGTYSTAGGKYTENIEFFSRDSSRVGSSLQFDYELHDGSWNHRGLSSKGDPINEVWSQREAIEKE